MHRFCSVGIILMPLHGYPKLHLQCVIGKVPIIVWASKLEKQYNSLFLNNDLN